MAAHLFLIADQQVELVEVAVDQALAGKAADELHASQIHLRFVDGQVAMIACVCVCAKGVGKGGG